MKLHVFMPEKLKVFYRAEMETYKLTLCSGDLQSAWKHLERAHILGQRYPSAHTYVHWKMLLFGVKVKSWREVLGQIPRLLVGGVKSFVGEVPVGNPGGSDVDPLERFPIAADLQLIFLQAGVE